MKPIIAYETKVEVLTALELGELPEAIANRMQITMAELDRIIPAAAALLSGEYGSEITYSARVLAGRCNEEKARNQLKCWIKRHGVEKGFPNVVIRAWMRVAKRPLSRIYRKEAA